MMNTSFFRASSFLCGLVLCLGISSCAGSYKNTAGSESTTAYDGWWIAKIQKTFPLQVGENWKMKCDNREGEFAFEVRDGLVITRLVDVQQETPITRAGKFKISQQTDFSISSDSFIYDGREIYVMYGHLGKRKPKGKFIVYVKEVHASCQTDVSFERSSDD